MKKTYIITFLTCAVSIALVLMLTCVFRRDADSTVKVGFIYVGDASTGYTGNFIAAQKELETLYQDRVEIMAMYNVAGGLRGSTFRDWLMQAVTLFFPQATIMVLQQKNLHSGIRILNFAWRPAAMPMRSLILRITTPSWVRYTREGMHRV